jgi:hypothetical protein
MCERYDRSYATTIMRNIPIYNKRSGSRWLRVSQSNGTSITAVAESIANM